MSAATFGLLALLALALALAAVWVVRPRPPSFDGERWFKVILATLLRGAVDGEGGDAAEWERRVARWVPWHPAGRLPERKVLDPAAWVAPGPPIPGEQALVEALTRLATPAERWARLYDRDEGARDALLADPEALGPACDLGALLGPGGGWDDLAAWASGGTAFGEAVRRALPARWVLVEGAPRAAPDVLSALADLLGPEARRVPWVDDADALVAAVGEALVAACPEPGDRAVAVGAGEGAPAILRALAADAQARDRLAAFVSIGGSLGGWPGRDGPWGEAACADWNAAHLTQEALDTEALRLTPYLAAQWLDRAAAPAGAHGLPLAAARLPEPRAHPHHREFVRAWDLGPLPHDAPAGLVARGLVAVTAGMVRAHP